MGFGQPKCGVWATKMWGLGNQNVGFGQPKCGVSVLGEEMLKATKMWGIYFSNLLKATKMWGLGNYFHKMVALLKIK